MSRALVLNATGKVSQAVIDGLVAKGHEVVAASRSPRESSEGVRWVRFDYADPSTFAPALDGVDRFFWVSPPLVLDGFALSKPFFDQAFTQVKRAVLMTANGVQFNDAIPLRQAELHVEKSGVSFTHLRPGWFMDNFHTFWIGSILGQNVIALPAGDAKTAFVDARDIGACGAAALTRDDLGGKALPVTGPQALTYAEAADILSRASGRAIKYVPIEDGAFLEGAVQAGIQRPYAELLVGLFQAVRSDAASQVETTVPDLTGKPARTLEEYARDHASVWRP